jgi:hypothetical protein
VVKGMEGDKEPRPDGFTMAFFSIVLGCGEERCYGCFLRIPLKTAVGEERECNFCVLGSEKGGSGGDKGFLAH